MTGVQTCALPICPEFKTAKFQEGVEKISDLRPGMALEGVVTKMDWINPHSWIHLEVTDAKGAKQEWMIEGGAPNALLRRGWNRNSLPAGTKILVQGFQAKDGSNRANGRDITFADGKKLFVGSSDTGAPDERPEK